MNKTQFARAVVCRFEVDDPFVYGGVSDIWVAPGAIGAVQNPSFGSADFRIRYVHPFGNVTGEFFMDIFNLFNQQTGVRTEDLEAGRGTAAFGDEIAWLAPRRSFLGVRFRF